MIRALFIWLALGAATLNSGAQDTFDSLEHAENQHDDTSSTSKFGKNLKYGEFELHLRSFYMQTINQGQLLDYNTLAAGAGIGYYSPTWKGFHVGFSGFFVFQLYEHNLAKADPTTENGNRYEITLYDMHDPENSKDLDRLEELFVDYTYKGLKILFGRQRINSPLLNDQDNRMRPNIFNGLTAQYHSGKWNLQANWITAVTPRGTVDWYSVEDSYGVYPFGRNHQGEPSQYSGNLKSHGIGVLGVNYETETKGLKTKSQAWNYLAENVFNLTFLQTDFLVKKESFDLDMGVQGFAQTAINKGGNSDPAKAYMLPDEKSMGVGAKFGVKTGMHGLSINYMGITKHGRFLFPREWGREIFYANLPRERYEGSGGLNAITLKYHIDLPVKGLTSEWGASQVNHAQLNEYKFNKYGLPSYYHFMGMVDYKFQGYLEGLDLRIMVINKLAQRPNQVPDNFRINRVDVWNINVMMDFRF
jgi:hypothetical protein